MITLDIVSCDFWDNLNWCRMLTWNQNRLLRWTNWNFFFLLFDVKGPFSCQTSYANLDSKTFGAVLLLYSGMGYFAAHLLTSSVCFALMVWQFVLLYFLVYSSAEHPGCSFSIGGVDLLLHCLLSHHFSKVGCQLDAMFESDNKQAWTRWISEQVTCSWIQRKVVVDP